MRATDDVPSGTHTRPGSASSTVIFPLTRFTGRAKKAGPQTHDHNSVNSGPIEKKPGKFLGKFAVEWILKLPSRPAHVATLPCGTT